jgi:cytochrome c oxidase cbb3-type subunit 2
VPYTQEDIAKADDDLKAQANGDGTDLAKRYPKAQARDFDGKPDKITEMDALVAYFRCWARWSIPTAPPRKSIWHRRRGDERRRDLRPAA